MLLSHEVGQDCHTENVAGVGKGVLHVPQAHNKLGGSGGSLPQEIFEILTI